MTDSWFYYLLMLNGIIFSLKKITATIISGSEGNSKRNTPNFEERFKNRTFYKRRYLKTDISFIRVKLYKFRNIPRTVSLQVRFLMSTKHLPLTRKYYLPLASNK